MGTKTGPLGISPHVTALWSNTTFKQFHRLHSTAPKDQCTRLASVRSPRATLPRPCMMLYEPCEPERGLFNEAYARSRVDNHSTEAFDWFLCYRQTATAKRRLLAEPTTSLLLPLLCSTTRWSIRDCLVRRLPSMYPSCRS
jgi:hypothetical protein